MLTRSQLTLVPEAGLEPAPTLHGLPSQGSVFTNFTTWAIVRGPLFDRSLIRQPAKRILSPSRNHWMEEH